MLRRETTPLSEAAADDDFHQRATRWLFSWLIHYLFCAERLQWRLKNGFFCLKLKESVIILINSDLSHHVQIQIRSRLTDCGSTCPIFNKDGLCYLELYLSSNRLINQSTYHSHSTGIKIKLVMVLGSSDDLLVIINTSFYLLKS